MPVPILVNQVFRGKFSNSSKPLRAPRPHPDEIARSHRIPGIAQPVDAAAFEHDQPVLHHMHFHHAERRARLVHHGVHCKIKLRLVGKQTFDLQIGIAIERMRGYRIFARNDQARWLRFLDSLVEFLNNGNPWAGGIVTVFFDNDPEGERGMKQALGYLAQLIPVRLAWMPPHSSVL